MHVFLTGATGFVGSYVLRSLIAHGHTARCLVRDADPHLVEGGDPVETVRGDVTDPATLNGAMEGCDAVIHLVGIIDEKPAHGVTFEALHVEGTIHVVHEAKQAGIERFIHMSANGAHPNGASAYQTTKWRAEQHVKESGFDHWTIFRPSIIFGDPGPDGVEFASRLVQTLVDPFPILPVFGDGRYQLAPIAVEAVADAFVQALTTDAASGQTYCASGWQAFPFNTVLDRIAKGMNTAPKPKLHIPLWLGRPLVKLFGRLGLAPISIDQLEMLVSGNTCDPSAFFDDFDVDDTPFTPKHLAYLRTFRR
jgi:NADH dehydrogenase